MKFLSRLRQGLAFLAPGQFSLRHAVCPFCGPSLLVRLNASEAGVRCVRCAASTVHLSMGVAVKHAIGPALSRMTVYELSAAGPFVEHLRRHARQAAFSEYHPDVPPGEPWNGVRCEDVQALTFADASFDLVTHSEVFEHVPDDARGFAELRRVLRPGGKMLFTVPFFDAPQTVERARLRGGASNICCHRRTTSIRSRAMRRSWCFVITGVTSWHGWKMPVLAMSVLRLRRSRCLGFGCGKSCVRRRCDGRKQIASTGGVLRCHSGIVGMLGCPSPCFPPHHQ